jgi:alpha-galactosidase
VAAPANLSGAPTISYDAQQKAFHLRTPSTSYVLQVIAGGMLAHVYWGRRLQSASWPGMRNGHEGAVAPRRLRTFGALHEQRPHAAAAGARVRPRRRLPACALRTVAPVGRLGAQYKALRGLIQFGDFYRLRSPFEGIDTAWMVVAKDKSEAFVVYVHVLAEANAPLDWLRLRGLDPAAHYTCEADGKTYGGDQLMYAGLFVPPMNADFLSVACHLRSNAR